MYRTRRYVTVMESDLPGESRPVLATFDERTVDEVVRIITERAQRPAEGRRIEKTFPLIPKSDA